MTCRVCTGPASERARWGNCFTVGCRRGGLPRRARGEEGESRTPTVRWPYGPSAVTSATFTRCAVTGSRQRDDRPRAPASFAWVTGTVATVSPCRSEDSSDGAIWPGVEVTPGGTRPRARGSAKRNTTKSSPPARRRPYSSWVVVSKRPPRGCPGIRRGARGDLRREESGERLNCAPAQGRPAAKETRRDVGRTKMGGLMTGSCWGCAVRRSFPPLGAIGQSARSPQRAAPGFGHGGPQRRTGEQLMARNPEGIGGPTAGFR